MIMPGRFPHSGSLWTGVGLAIALVLVATFVSASIPVLIFTPLAPFFVAVALSAWAAGTRPALIAMLGSLLPIHYVALGPRPVVVSPPEFAAYVVFILVSALLMLVTGSRDRAVKRAERERARAEVLADATRGLGGVNLDLSATLDAIAQSAAKEVGDLAVLRLLSRDGAWLEVVAWEHPNPSMNQSAAEHARDDRHAADQGVTGDALRAGRAIRLTAPEVAARKRDNPTLWPATLDTPSEVMLAAPLQLEGRGIGTLSVSRPATKQPYTTEDERFLQELADRAALAIERARLFGRVLTNEARLATLVERLPVGIGLTDDTGQLILTNAEMRLYVGDALPSSDPTQRPQWQCIGEDGALLPPDQWPDARALGGATVTGIECQVMGQADHPIWTRVTSAPFEDAEGEVAGVVSVVQNIDVQKRAEDEHVAFLDALAHDIKNPLSAARGQMQLARRRIDPGDPEGQRVARNLEAADRALDQASALLNEVLDVAHFRAGRHLELYYAPVDLVALAASCLEDLQERSPEHQLTLESQTTTLVGMWDGFRLERVLRNLLDNAVKFSPDGGEIRVLLDEHVMQDDTRWAVLRVKDAGVGIPSGDLDRIFERFQRGRNAVSISGNGIGLTGVRQIVQQHGGTIAVESQEGQGATFTVHLPLHLDSGGPNMASG
jgi:signal transduction histidine kinase